MRFRTLIGFAVIACFQRELLASMCVVPPPCKTIGPASILFTGVAVGVVPHTSGVPGESWSEARFEISEIFEGMPEPTKEAVISAEGDPFQKGRSYLIDARRTDNGQLYVAPCTNPGEIGGKKDERVDELLSYLRDRKAGNVDTSLTVAVNPVEPIVGAEVIISNAAGARKSLTDSDGRAEFRGIAAGYYSVTAALSHYHLDPKDGPPEEVDVLPGTCENARINLLPETAITGLVLDSKGTPMANLALELELITDAHLSPEEVPVSPPWDDAITDAEGRFRFESVSPGRYLLGSNITGLYPSTVPPTFYPGQRNRIAAVPVEVKLGESIELPPLRLPDYGNKRTIQICVVDQAGKSVSSASVRNAFREEGFVGLPDDLVTDATGCVKTVGYANASYRISAMFVPGGDNRQARFSDDVVISPAKESRVEVLRLTR